MTRRGLGRTFSTNQKCFPGMIPEMPTVNVIQWISSSSFTVILSEPVGHLLGYCLASLGLYDSPQRRQRKKQRSKLRQVSLYIPQESVDALTCPKPHCVFSPNTQFAFACISEKTTRAVQITNATENIPRRLLSPFGSHFLTFSPTQETFGGLSCFIGLLFAFTPLVLLMTNNTPNTRVTRIENNNHPAQRPK